MLNRVERRLDEFQCEYVRLDGSVPQKKRPQIISTFQDNPDCRVILMTNAGSTGLNLQKANVVINADLPWNPAVLEQRIARAHRMGQENPVHIYNLVTTDTIEEGLLETLASKQELADASLDMESDVDAVAVTSGTDDLKRKLEKLLIKPLPAPVDESQRRRVESEAERLQARRAKVSDATGQLVTAALSLAGELISQTDAPTVDNTKVDQLTERLSESIETDAEGRPQLTITLPDKDALRGLATTLAKLLEG
jgi:superfamily II DNA/RNA helicase